MSLQDLQCMKAQLDGYARDIEQIDKQIEHLQAEKWKIEEQQCKGKRRFTHLAIEYGKSECLQLVAAMFRKLPGELRNEVYANLYLEAAPIRLESKPHLKGCVCVCGQDDLSRKRAQVPWRAPNRQVPPLGGSKQATLDGHTVDPGYVGEEMAVEGTGFYYGRNAFEVRIGESSDEICMHRTLMRKPHFAGAPSPGDHVQNLVLQVRFDLFPELMRDCVFCEDDLDRREMLTLSNMQRIMGSVTHARRPQPLTAVEFILHTCFVVTRGESVQQQELERLFFNFLESLRRPVYEVQSAGAVATVKHRNDDGQGPSRCADITWRFGLVSDSVTGTGTGDGDGDGGFLAKDAFLSNVDMERGMFPRWPDHGGSEGFGEGLRRRMEVRWGIKDGLKVVDGYDLK
ncbi:hypothetical protein B0J11DRAFT_261657 [Dendryphion nanum]|uniref:Uncharacterized protein n=1 Tax=Dendryphion nanum TaxID=256645 RepID=A0A9P9ITX4_9PLEO|nr:hypothetical protein B0J11DRAFT_261657 [Dendryphion nanum]